MPDVSSEPGPSRFSEFFQIDSANHRRKARGPEWICRSGAPLARHLRQTLGHLGRIEQTTVKPAHGLIDVIEVSFSHTDGRNLEAKRMSQDPNFRVALRPQDKSAGNNGAPFILANPRFAVRQASFLALFVTTLFICAGCSSNKEQPPPPPPGVTIAPVIQKDVPIHQEWVGTMAGNVDADIRPKVEGFLLARLYTEGSFMEKGQPMFQLHNPQATAAAEQPIDNFSSITPPS